MKNQALFSSKDKSKKLKCRLLQFLFGAFRVKSMFKNPSATTEHDLLRSCNILCCNVIVYFVSKVILHIHMCFTH